jgi:hypothetical protein
MDGRMKISIVSILIGSWLLGSASANTLAYWRFEEGPLNAAVLKSFGAVDSSGNGNHLDPGTEAGNNGFRYRSDRALISIPKTQAANAFSVQNSGNAPSMATRSTTRSYGIGSNPAGIDIEAVTPAQFTIEAFFKPENGGWRTIVGRDAQNVVTGSAALAALYFQIRPDNGVKVGFTDVSGYWHVAESAEYVIKGFNWSSDPQGLTGNWYYMAAVSNGYELTLYLANVSANGPLQLLARTNIFVSGSPNRSLAKGTTNGTNWHAGGWSVGRGLHNGNHTDRAYGFIDEVRISDAALSPDQFLFPQESQPPAAEHNPILTAADPDILLVDNKVWMYPTSGEREKFYAFSSPTLTAWIKHGPILNIDNIPWMPDGKWGWAPGIVEKDGTYYLYFCAGHKPAYTGVATSSSPAGPFIDSGAPLVADNNQAGFTAIDPMVFTDPQTGKTYLYVGGGGDPKLRLFELNPDLISIHHEIAVDTPYLYNEAPFMHYRDGIYYLSYSHGHYQYERYSVHYSTSSSPAGPWTYQGPLLVSDYRHKAPGHHSFLYNAAMDQWVVFYHRYNNRTGTGPYTGSRSICMEYMDYNPNGTIKPFALTNTGVGRAWLGNFLRADFNQSGQVEIADLLYLAGAWLTNDSTADMAPIGGDNIVDLTDLAAFAEQWLKSLP